LLLPSGSRYAVEWIIVKSSLVPVVDILCIQIYIIFMYLTDDNLSDVQTCIDDFIHSKEILILMHTVLSLIRILNILDSLVWVLQFPAED